MTAGGYSLVCRWVSQPAHWRLQPASSTKRSQEWHFLDAAFDARALFDEFPSGRAGSGREQRLDRCDSHQILHGIGELPVERDQSVGLELGQSYVLGVKRVRPAKLVGDLPCGVLKEVFVVFAQMDPHPARVEEASLSVFLGHLTAVYCLVEERHHLRAKKRRGQHMMPVGNHDLFAS